MFLEVLSMMEDVFVKKVFVVLYDIECGVDVFS